MAKILDVGGSVDMGPAWELVEYSRAEWRLVGDRWDQEWVLVSVYVYATREGPYREQKHERYLELTLEERYRVEQRNKELGYV